MNEQVKMLLSSLLMAGGGFLVGKGYISQEQLAWAVGAILTLAGSAWALWKSRPTGLIKSTSKLAAVEGITVNDPSIAAVTPENVTTAK